MSVRGRIWGWVDERKNLGQLALVNRRFSNWIRRMPSVLRDWYIDLSHYQPEEVRPYVLGNAVSPRFDIFAVYKHMIAHASKYADR